jgi:hypothetical protein
MGVAASIRREVLASRRSWAAMVIGCFLGFQVVQLVMLVVRFEALPNYVTFHDWPGNVAGIVRSTPSVSDMVPIILDEWLVEIGSMNYAFGRGIAEWSLVLMPAKLMVVLLIAILLATDIVLLRSARNACSLSARVGAAAATTTGALIAGAALTTITWVVCCAAPTWAVGLAVMGVGVTTALALQPIGGWLTLLGIAALLGMAIVLARQLSGRPAQVAARPLPRASTRIARVTP